MAQFACMVKFVVKPAQRARLLAEIHTMVAQTQDEGGTLLYIAHASVDDENELWMYELFSDEEAAGTHQSSAVHERGVQVLLECLEEEPEFHILNVSVAGKGIPDRYGPSTPRACR
jgi:quinol monooxygenase YgiN